MSTLRVLDKDGNWVDIPTIVGPVGPVGQTGETGPGVSSGGSTGQILRKKSEDDFDTEWVTPTDMDLYYTKEEANDLINSKISTTFKYKGTKANYAAIQAITNPAVGDVWNDASTDHNYVWNGSAWDKLAGTVDMTNYYTKDEAEDMVDDKLAEVPINDLLHYKGHVNSVSDLPNLGQASGGYITPALSLGVNSTDWILVPATGRDVLYSQIRDLGYSYFATIETRDYKDYRTGVGVLTEYPEQVSIQFEHRGNYTSYTPIYGMVFHIKYDPNKPVYYTYNKLSSGPAPSIKTATTEMSFSNTIKTPATPTLVTEDMIIGVKGLNSYGSNYGGVYDSSDQLCAAIRITTNFPALHYTASDIYFSTPYKTLTTANGYNYNTGMILLSNNTGNVSDTKYQTNTTAAVENDMYTVGDMYEIYRCNEEPAWEKWSDFKEFSTTTMTEADYIELEDKNGFDLYVLDRVAEITETTNLLLNSITGDVDLVEANISEEEALAITDEIIGGVSDE